MSSLEDKLILKAWDNGYTDFIKQGYDAECPYDKASCEGKCWIMGYEDSMEDYNKMEGEEYDL